MKHYFFFTLLLLVSSNLAAEQGLRVNPSDDGRPADSYPPCDEKFEKACKDAGGTLSKTQGWGGKTCFKSLEDDYCKGATRRPQSLRVK